MIILIALLVAVLLVVATTPKPPSQSTSDSQLTVPVAEDGREIMDIAGTCWIDDANVIDYGGLYTTPIRADGGK